MSKVPVMKPCPVCTRPEPCQCSCVTCRLSKAARVLTQDMERAADAVGMVRESIGTLQQDRMECEALTRLLMEYTS